MPVHRATVDPARVVGLDPRAMGRDLPPLGWASIVERKLDEPSARCRALWAAVMLVALADARAGDAAARAILRRPEGALLRSAGINPGAWPRALRRLEAEWQALDAARRSRKSKAPARRVEGPGAAAGAPEASLAA